MPLGLSIRSVTKEYENGGEALHVLGPIDFEVEAGEFLCVLGESGCGKSTLLRLLAGLEQPSSGTLLVGGEPIEGPDHQRGLVFQRPSLLPWLSVEQNVRLGFRIRGQEVPVGDVRETIDLVGLKGFEAARPAQLSGGMAQRAALARALVAEPSVLLMDEPFAALDALTRLRMQGELQRIWRARKGTVVFVTHDIDEAISLGMRILVMTPRPGIVGRVFSVALEYPRQRRAMDFLRLHAMIADELTLMTDAGHQEQDHRAIGQSGR